MNGHRREKLLILAQITPQIVPTRGVNSSDEMMASTPQIKVVVISRGRIKSHL